MIVFVNPRATRPKNRRFPLSVMAIGAALPDDVTWAIVDGRSFELDCLIFATGFEVGSSFTRRAGYDVIGRGGMTLSQRWADG